MTNHIHWLARPAKPDSRAVFLRRVHGRYAQYLNTRCGLSGHLWHGRFFSCMSAPARLPLVLRYIETRLNRQWRPSRQRRLAPAIGRGAERCQANLSQPGTHIGGAVESVVES